MNTYSVKGLQLEIKYKKIKLQKMYTAFKVIENVRIKYCQLYNRYFR